MGTVIVGGFPLLTEGESVTVCAEATTAGPGVGVDRLSVSFPVERPDLDAFHQRTTTGHGSSQGVQVGERVVLAWREGVPDGRPPKPAASVFLGAAMIEGKWWGKVECNPSRIVDPQGCSLAPLDSLDMVGDVLGDVVTRYLEPTCSWGEFGVKRVDVARDFQGVASPGFYVRGLLNVRRPYAKRTYLYADPARGNAETLYAGSGAGGVRLYDQHAAYADRGAARGAVRWEVEARGDWLAKVTGREGAPLVRDLTPHAMMRLGRERWEWSGMGTQVDATVNVVEAIERMVCRCREVPGQRKCSDPERHVQRAKADRLLGMLVREAFGVGGVDRMTTSRYRELREALGAVPTAELMGAAVVPVSGRLDYDRGAEVLAA